MKYKDGNKKIYYILYGLDYFYGCSFHRNNAYSIFLSCIYKHPNCDVYMYENYLKDLICAGYRGNNEHLVMNHKK